MSRAVITFHSIDDSASVLSYSARAFARLLERLVTSGIPLLSFAELKNAPTGVTITFDDGMASVAANALPVLRDLGIPSHLFLTTGAVGGDNRWPSQPGGIEPLAMMDWPAIEACAAAGMSVENHTVYHPDLRTLTAAAIVEECARADEAIERRLGRRPLLFAYPYGYVNETARDAIASRYVAAFTADLGFLTTQADAHRLPRIDSYYLRSPVIADRFLTGLGRGYLSFRAAMRTLRRVL
jgi:peptidoglycan/xylan/chitin deacetylase (PgdA/CDA1 family)